MTQSGLHLQEASTIPIGTTELFGVEMRQQQAVIDILRSVYERFGFDPLHTPILEHAKVFSGHHGEGEKLLFRLYDSGGYELVNRYDLTVPLARFVSAHPEIPRPFKRYQIEPVFRDDEPDEGHFREFTQCDGDVIGNSSLTADAEVINVAYFGLKSLGFEDFVIRVGHRGLIRAIARKANILDAAGVLDVQRALDFSDKITKDGVDGIRADLLQYGISRSVADVIVKMIMITGATEFEKLANIRTALAGFEQNGWRGTEELATIFSMLPDEVMRHVSVDLTLSRGADYYTGFILEGVIPVVSVGAVLGGGRYDGLVGKFNGSPEPAVGMAFGLERIMIAMREIGLLSSLARDERLLVVQRDGEDLRSSMAMVMRMRSMGVSVDFVQNPTLDAVSYGTERGFTAVFEIRQGESHLLAGKPVTEFMPHTPVC